MNGYFVERSSDLTHHGILGQRWGKKNGPPYPLGASDHSSSEKKAGWKKSLGNGRNESKYGRNSKTKSNVNVNTERSQKAAKLISRDYDARKKANAEWKKTEERLSKIEAAQPKDNEWFEKDGKLTAKAKAYMKKYDDEYEKYRKKEDQYREEEKQEEQNLIKDTFFSEEIKPDMEKAKKVKEKIENLYNDTISDDSGLANDAYKQFLKDKGYKDNDDSAYEFFHYTWREGHPAYDNALKTYNNSKKDLQKELDQATTNIAKKVLGEIGDKKIKGYSFTYVEAGKERVNSILNSYNWKKYYS